ncbi:MAG: hypothetical protein EZS28_006062, partial [Streblomastix strix]
MKIPSPITSITTTFHYVVIQASTQSARTTFIMRLSNDTMGPVKTKYTKKSRMSQCDTPTPTLISRDGPDKEPRDRDSVVNKELRGNQSQFPETLTLPSQGSQSQSSCHATDSYTRIDDDFMEDKGCEVYVNEQTGEIQVRFRGIPKAIVKEQGLFSIQTN